MKFNKLYLEVLGVVWVALKQSINQSINKNNKPEENKQNNGQIPLKFFQESFSLSLETELDKPKLLRASPFMYDSS